MFGSDGNGGRRLVHGLLWLLCGFGSIAEPKMKRGKNNVETSSSRRVILPVEGPGTKALRTFCMIALYPYFSRNPMFFISFYCFVLFCFPQPGAVHWNSNFVRFQNWILVLLARNEQGQMCKGWFTRTSLYSNSFAFECECAN